MNPLETTKMKHTSTPWEIDEHDNTIIANIDGGYGDDGSQVKFDTICQFEDSYGDVLKNWRENRKHVVKCVNCHDELLEALELLLQSAEHCDPLFSKRWETSFNRAKSAINKAKGL